MVKSTAIKPDILLVVLDDLWAGDLTEERTPNAWALGLQSRIYTRTYSNPVCWHSRACLTWGMYGRHFDPPIIEAMGVTNGPEPAAGVPTAASLLRDVGYSTCLVGKWHRGRNPGTPSGPTAFLGAPQARGYVDVRAMAPSNLGSWDPPWDRVDGLVTSEDPVYATISQTHAAIDWWAFAALPRFMEVSLSAPHPPAHVPPSELLGGYEPDPSLPPARKKYEYQIRSADWALGQILAAVGPEAIVILCSDNGAPFLPPGAPPGHGKSTCFEYGIRVPLSIRSRFAPGITNRLVHIVDIPATILSLAGVPVPANWDGKCLFGTERPSCLSEAVMADGDIDVWDRAAMTKTHKLRRVNRVGAADGPEELYDLLADQNELNPLDVMDPAYASILTELRAVLA